MATLLLRTMTRKSLIGFGDFKDLTVQNLIDTLRHKELLSLYYTCRNIDFNEELIAELKIDKVFRIDKKNKRQDRWIKESNKYINQCLYLIISENEKMVTQKMRIGFSNKKYSKQKNTKIENYSQRKIILRSKNQYK